jgi:uncharacterized protein involved in exopolysaccharide biosynthesis
VGHFREEIVMEIVDYLAVARRHRILLIAIPLLAAVLAALPIVLAPHSYTANATVSTTALITGPSSQFSGSQAVGTFVSQFSATAQGPAVISAAAKQTNVPYSDIVNGLTVTQSGTSSNMVLSYTGTDAKTVQPVLTAVDSLTLKSMFSLQVALAKQQVAAAQRAVAGANQALTALGQQYQVANPQAAYQAQLAQYNKLVQRQSALQLAGNSQAASALRSSISASKIQLTQFQSALAKYNNLSATQQAAIANLGTAQQNYQSVLGQYQAANPTQITYFGKVQPVGRVSKLIHAVVPALAAGVVIAVVLVMLLELVRDSRRKGPRRGSSSGPERDAVGRIVASHEAVSSLD